jgi:hypothetical protein
VIRRALVLGALLLAAACGGRRETSEIAAGMAPFNELAGIPFTVLRSGGARALRRNIAPVMGVGLRKTIGEYEVTYSVPVFDSASGDWPVEEALVLEVAATRSWGNDSLARAGWIRTIADVMKATTTVPRCLAAASATDSLATLAEFDRGDSLTLGAEFVASQLASDSTVIPAMTHLVIRRTSLTAPAWTAAPCPST